jgi:hypothetical protein
MRAIDRLCAGLLLLGFAVGPNVGAVDDALATRIARQFESAGRDPYDGDKDAGRRKAPADFGVDVQRWLDDRGQARRNLGSLRRLDRQSDPPADPAG